MPAGGGRINFDTTGALGGPRLRRRRTTTGHRRDLGQRSNVSFEIVDRSFDTLIHLEAPVMMLRRKSLAMMMEARTTSSAGSQKTRAPSLSIRDLLPIHRFVRWQYRGQVRFRLLSTGIRSDGRLRHHEIGSLAVARRPISDVQRVNLIP